MINQEILKYLQTHIAQSAKRLEGHTKDSRGHTLFKRSVYIVLEKHIDAFRQGDTDPRMIIMPGLRGTGKTTLLAQLFLNLPNHGLSKFYVTVDEVVKRFDINLWDFFDHYEEILGEHLENLKEPLILFLDEIHYDSKWASFIKGIYDRTKKVMIVCTGSAALLLREQMNADIARRAIFVDIHPVNFSEYLLLKDHKPVIKGLSEDLKNAFLYSTSADQIYMEFKKQEEKVKDYWKDITLLEIQRFVKLGTLPFTIHFSNESLAIDYIGQMINKVIYTDIPQFAPFDFETLNKIEKILYLLSSDVGMSVKHLSGTIETKANLLHSILDALVKAGLLIRVLPYGGHFKQVRKPSKYLFVTPALRYYFLSSRDSVGVFNNYQGYLFEDIAGMYLSTILEKSGNSSLTYDVAEGGADFIITRADRKIVIEVGAGEKNIKQVIQTMNKINGNLGVILHSGKLDLDKKNNVVSVPWGQFLLI